MVLEIFRIVLMISFYYFLKKIQYHRVFQLLVKLRPKILSRQNQKSIRKTYSEAFLVTNRRKKNQATRHQKNQQKNKCTAKYQNI